MPIKPLSSAVCRRVGLRTQREQASFHTTSSVDSLDTESARLLLTVVSKALRYLERRSRRTLNPLAVLAPLRVNDLRALFPECFPAAPFARGRFVWRSVHVRVISGLAPQGRR